MKISVITVVYNGEKYLEQCIQSVLAQNYHDLEYLVIDGGSKDRSLAIIDKYRSQIDFVLSENDRGMYDALNKGIHQAKGEVIGILNADDMFASNDVISSIANAFTDTQVDISYGNLNYVDPDNPEKIIRRWVSKPFSKDLIQKGWMPAHPTFYAKRDLFNKFGTYSLNFNSAADYELMVRFLTKPNIRAKFIDKLMVNMRTGGMSNASLKHRYRALVNDYKALRVNKVPFAAIVVTLKKMQKITQFLY